MRKLKLPGRDVTRPRLEDHDVKLIQKVGIKDMREQARDIIKKKLEVQPENDGSQTPTKGNPIYKAMHACNVSSRKELSMSHRIPAGRDLSEREIDSIVNLVMRWIAREYNFFMKEREEMQRNLSDF